MAEPLKNREELITELKASGKIPQNLDCSLLPDEKLIEVSLNPSLSGNPGHFDMNDLEKKFTDKLNNALADFSVKSKEDLAKLPSMEITEDEEKQLKLEARGDQDLTRLKNNAVMRKFLQMVIVDPQGFKHKTLALNTEASGAVGGYTVPIEFEGQIAQLLALYGKFRANCSIAGMNSKTLTKPRLLTGVTATWTGENTAATETNPTFDQITYTRHKLDAVSGMTLELLQDTGSDLMGELSLLFAQAFAREEDIQGWAGTGSPITGIFNTSGIKTTATSTSSIASMTYADINTMIGKLLSNALPGSKFYMHRTTLFNVISNMVDNVNRPIFTPNVTPYLLFGYPVELVETFNDTSITTANTPFIMFGNLKWSYLRQRIGMYMRMSDTATIGGASAFEKDLMWFKPSESLDIQHEIPSAYSVLTNKTT